MSSPRNNNSKDRSHSRSHSPRQRPPPYSPPRYRLPPSPQRGSRDRRRERSYSGERRREESPRSRSRQRHVRERRDEGRRPYDNDEYYRRDRGYADRGYRREEEDRSHFKTRICPLFEKGLCKRGETCTFAHGEKELRGLPNFKKTRLCIPFKNGECPRTSEQCNYAHGEAEIKKLAYDYFPQKHREDKLYQDRGYQRHESRPYRDDYRDSRGSRDRYRGRYEGSRDQGYANYGPYVAQYNSAYMYPPFQQGYPPQQSSQQGSTGGYSQGGNYQYMSGYEYPPYGYYPSQQSYGFGGSNNSNTNNSQSKPPQM